MYNVSLSNPALRLQCPNKRLLLLTYRYLIAAPIGTVPQKTELRQREIS